MKKILAICVACMYLAITSGLVLQIHYCMDKQVGSSVKFAAVNTRTCTACGMQNAKNNCCHDEVKFIKLQDVHQQVTADYTMAPPPAIVLDVDVPGPLQYVIGSPVATCNPSPPDEDGQPPLFIFYHLFRI